ncbi:hypothetical protein AB0M72_27305 [Nocardiopsis dassonvillei]
MDWYVHLSATTVVRERATDRLAACRRRSTRVRGYALLAEVA